jgi:hypothetical protein
MVSAAVAHLPAAVSLLLLEALFMQISGVSLTLTWPCRLCLLRVLLGKTTAAFQVHWGRWHCTHISGQRVYLQFTWEVTLSPSPVEFSSHRRFYKLSRTWLLGSAAAPAFSGRLVYLQFREGLPLSPPLVLRAPCFLCYVSFFSPAACLLFSLFFSLGGSQSVQGAMLT